ncbi:MAG: BON domain-containing protein [Sedimentisphaerales bacterium]|nr:BON domain-containing protein [Sedimentisphaerales bacterium]
MLTDENLTELIRIAIKRDERVYLQPIDVSIDDGIVTFTGTVRSHRRNEVAYEIASSFEGCRDVVNKLVIDPAAPLPDMEIAKNIVSSLNASADIESDAINVGVTNGVASLNGVMSSQWERHVAEDVARSVHGVRDVENLIAVNPIAEIDHEALALEIKTALDHARDLRGTKIEVKISGKTVVLLGIVYELSQKETVERVVRRFGLQDIGNEIIVRP